MDLKLPDSFTGCVFILSWAVVVADVSLAGQRILHRYDGPNSRLARYRRHFHDEGTDTSEQWDQQ